MFMDSVEVEQVLEFGDRICDFLLSCGGSYKKLTPDIQRNVFHALGSGQYVLKEINGELVYFVSYWKVFPTDIDCIKSRQCRPENLSNGTVMYVSEAANTIGKDGMAEIIKKLRAQAVGMKGLFWHRPAKKDSIYHFPSQKGKGA